MKRLCTLCARGGSKGVPGKNIRPLLGKPLLAHSLLQAQTSGLFDTIAVSSDSEEILQTALKYGANLLITRPPDLAGDEAAKIPAIAHCAEEAERLTGIKYDTVTDLDATSPLRTIADIAGAVHLLETSEACNVITGHSSRRSPYFNIVEHQPDGSVKLVKTAETPIVRRQDAPRTYDMNASVYVWRRVWLRADYPLFTKRTLLYVMDAANSADIDSELDFLLVEELMRRRGADS
ncbi:cytidylyltransferase domain-containing protein [Paenibacillus sp. GCM10012307]|uniref:Acylneuraminate cytidylyltransferase family protein n=1 Tax=Paenibacillus roseus TaxID=2798579 RepID=A0A934MP16_9BACL|nr:acylneuraminate cytidylyltransferase family protein [Paenibacillus roseus]MBJ6359979.1 acylneuraminate cytidylyltransferase family protein [Paenibacillus roseus]